MVERWTWLVAAVLCVACAGSQAASDGSTPEATETPTAEASATQAPATSASPVATSATPPASASEVHASGGPKCDELAKACHEVGHGADELGKCHEIGHAGDTAACEKEHARCVALCQKAAKKGGHHH